VVMAGGVPRGAVRVRFAAPHTLYTNARGCQASCGAEAPQLWA